MIRNIALAVTGAAALSGPMALQSCETDTRPDCVGDVVTVPYNQVPTCDVNPPQRLDLVYPAGTTQSFAQANCAHWGGTLRNIWLRWVCIDVDY